MLILESVKFQISLRDIYDRIKFDGEYQPV